jgi:hypothetical protein
MTRLANVTITVLTNAPKQPSSCNEATSRHAPSASICVHLRLKTLTVCEHT